MNLLYYTVLIILNAYDIETYESDSNNESIPYCICFLIRSKSYQIYYEDNLDIILKSLETIFSLKITKCVIYIHNLNFDGILIIKSLSNQRKFKFTLFSRKLNIYTITIYYNKFQIIFKCSYKLLPVSLKKIALDFTDKKKMIFPYKFSSLKHLNYIGEKPSSSYFNFPQEYNLLQMEIFNFKEYSLKYCMNDVYITAIFVYQLSLLLKDFKINIEKVLSTPSISLEIFKKKFNKNKIILSINNAIENYARNSYHGGRTEVYGNAYDNEFVYHFDFSGMYAQVMKEKFGFGNYKILEVIDNFDYPGFYWIKYESNINIPVLPHKRLSDSKLMFVNGINSGVFWFEEIKLFIEQGGRVLKIKSALIYEKYDYVFNEFVDYFNEVKVISSAHKIFAKLMINSLYGRLGMNQEETMSCIILLDEFEYYNKNYDIIKSIELNNYVFIEILLNYKVKNSKNLVMSKNNKIKNNIGIAASITAKARIKLYKAQLSVINNGGRLLYSDTDSIFAAYKKNVDNEKHGEVFWDISKNDTKIKKSVFIAPKTYSLVYESNEEIVKIKGYNQNKLDFDTLESNFYKEKNISISDYLYIDKKNFNLRNIIIEKKFSLFNYDKRKFSIDKKETAPYYFKDFIYK